MKQAAQWLDEYRKDTVWLERREITDAYRVSYIEAIQLDAIKHGMELAAGVANEEISEETFSDYDAGASDKALDIKDKILKLIHNKTSI